MTNFFRALGFYLSGRYSLFVVIVFVIAIPCVIAHLKGDISLLKAILLIMFASFTVLSFITLFFMLEKNPIGVHRSSPTIDGSISGWRLTNSLAHLLLTAVFAVATLIIYFDNPKTIVAAATSEINKKDSTVRGERKTTDSLTKKDSTKIVKEATDSAKPKLPS